MLAAQKSRKISAVKAYGPAYRAAYRAAYGLAREGGVQAGLQGSSGLLAARSLVSLHGAQRVFCDHFVGGKSIRKGSTWAIAVRRGSYKSLFLLNSGRFCREK